MQVLDFKKQHQSDIAPAFSNRDIYELIHGKKPPGRINKRWLAAKRIFRPNDTWSGSTPWNLVGGISLLLVLVAFLFYGDAGIRQNIFPIQLGAAAFLFLYLLSKKSRETTLFKASGVLAILAAAVVPVLVLSLYSSWTLAALFLPAQLAICGIAALFRSDENLDPGYIVFKALSYLVATLLTGWLSFYAHTNLYLA